MRSSMSVTDDQVAAILKLLRQGLGTAEVARRAGVTMSVVAGVRKHQTMNQYLRPTVPATAQQIEETLSLLDRGKSSAQAAEIVGIKRSQVAAIKAHHRPRTR